MKAQCVRSWRLGKTITHLLATSGGHALALSKHRRQLWTLLDEEPRVVELGPPSAEYSAAGNPLGSEFEGALIAYREGWAVIYSDVVHIGGADAGTVHTVQIENQLPRDGFGRTQVPMLGCSLPDGSVAVALSTFGNNKPEQLAWLGLDEVRAQWLDAPTCLAWHGLTTPEEDAVSRDGRSVIGALGLTSTGDLLLQSSGADRSYHRYGMPFCALAAVDRAAQCSLRTLLDPPGFAFFSADRRGLLLDRLRAPRTLDTYDLEGRLSGTLRITPKLTADRRRLHWPPLYDRCDSELWLADPFDGLVCRLRLS
jgi:hypothetical protein